MRFLSFGEGGGILVRAGRGPLPRPHGRFCFLPLFLICGFFVFWHMGVCSESVSCSYACFLKWFLMCRFLNLFLALVSCSYAVLSGVTERFGGRARIDGTGGRNTEATGVLKRVYSFLSPVISPKTVFWFWFSGGTRATVISANDY